MGPFDYNLQCLFKGLIILPPRSIWQRRSAWRDKGSRATGYDSDCDTSPTLLGILLYFRVRSHLYVSVLFIYLFVYYPAEGVVGARVVGCAVLLCIQL